MGSPKSEKGHRNDEVEHRVRLTKPYSLHQFPVTNVQYELFDPVHRNDRCDESKDDEHPVVKVSWYEAWCFARWVAHPEGQTRLPTEAEWEYACRGGAKKKSAFWFGDDPADVVNHAWCNESLKRRTHTLIESQTAGGHENPFALYDMHGNVSEWCSDLYGEYDTQFEVDPIGPSVGSYRVHRGGCWDLLASDCRAAFRDWVDPSGRDYNLGFRLLLSPSVK
jgi:formylglycine-generating enzyme required for sulfatase activity